MIMRTFDKYHPVTLFVYFLPVLGITMFFNHPVFLLLAFLGAVSITVLLDYKRFFRDSTFFLTFFIIAVVVNPLMNHNGKTLLFFVNGNAITFEAVWYGCTMAVMLVAVLYWFRLFTDLMTSDRLLYLFGGITPKLSLVLSMALRYIPLFRVQIHKINQTQRAMGLYSKDNYISNVKGTLRVFSIMITWSLENAIDTADSMHARGYREKHWNKHPRTRYHTNRFRKPDIFLLTVSLLLTVVTLAGILLGAADYEYYPVTTDISLSLLSVITYTAYGILVFLPVIIKVKENLQWIYYKSKI